MARASKKAAKTEYEPQESTQPAQFYGDAETPKILEPEPTAGRYPRGYARSDDRIRQDVRARLTAHSTLDASDIDVRVAKQEVLLCGHVSDPGARRLAADIAEGVGGVRAVRTKLYVASRRGARQRRAG